MVGNFQTLQDFATEVERVERNKNDYIVPDHSIHMRTPGEVNISNTGVFQLNETAHMQLAAKLDIPKRYYDRMKEVPGLREYTVNALLNEADDTRFIRTIDNKVRAVLSKSYQPIDNFMILQSAFPVLKLSPDLVIRSFSLSDTRMYLQVTFPRMQAEVTPGDVVEYGLTLTNSEVGLGAVNVQTFLHRLVCSNGLVRQSLLNKRHLGKRLLGMDGDAVLFQRDTLMAETESFRLRFRDILQASFTDVAFEQQIAELRKAAGDKFDRPEKVIQNVTKRFGLNEIDGEHILTNMVNDGDFSRWGLVNGVTALCHREGVTVDKQYQYEIIGGEIIDLKPGEWEVLSA